MALKVKFKSREKIPAEPLCLSNRSRFRVQSSKFKVRSSKFSVHPSRFSVYLGAPVSPPAFPQLSTLNPQPQLNPVNSVDFGNQNCTGSGGVRFPGPKNAVFACIGGLGTRFPAAVPNGSRGSQPVSMVQFFPPWPGQLPTPNHPATCIICVSAPVPVHSTFVSLTHSPTHTSFAGPQLSTH